MNICASRLFENCPDRGTVFQWSVRVQDFCGGREFPLFLISPPIPRRRTARDVLSIRALFTIQILGQIVEIPQNPSSLASSLALRRIDGDFVAGKKLLVFLATLTNGAFSRPSEDHLGNWQKRPEKKNATLFFHLRLVVVVCWMDVCQVLIPFFVSSPSFSLTTAAADPKVGGM